MRIVLASLAALVMVMGIVAGGYVYINRVAAGIGRVPVMFSPAHVTSRPVPGAAQSGPPIRESPSQTPAAPR